MFLLDQGKVRGPVGLVDRHGSRVTISAGPKSSCRGPLLFGATRAEARELKSPPGLGHSWLWQSACVEQVLPYLFVEARRRIATMLMPIAPAMSSPKPHGGRLEPLLDDPSPAFTAVGTIPTPGRTTLTGTGVGIDKSGQPNEVYLYHVTDNEWSMREYGVQAVVWQAALNPVVALELLATGAWSGEGVLGPEALDAVPFLDLMKDGYQQPFGTRRTMTSGLERPRD